MSFSSFSPFGFSGGSSTGGGGGGSSVPVLEITAGDFDVDGKTANIPALAGISFILFDNNVPTYLNYSVSSPTYPVSLWKPLLTGGFEILIPGFDAGGANSDCKFILLVTGTVTTPLATVAWENVTGKPFTITPYIMDVALAGDETIPNPSVTFADGDLFYYYITPNQFNYTWGTLFLFPYAQAPTPSAGAGAIDLYVFQYRSATGLLYCVTQTPGFNQSL